MSISENKGEGRKESHLNCAAFDFKIARNESLVDLLLLLFAKGPPPPNPSLKGESRPRRVVQEAAGPFWGAEDRIVKHHLDCLKEGRLPYILKRSKRGQGLEC